MKHLNCKLYYRQLHLKYWCNLARYWLQAVWGWHDSVETCSSVIICEIIVCIGWSEYKITKKHILCAFVLSSPVLIGVTKWILHFSLLIWTTSGQQSDSARRTDIKSRISCNLQRVWFHGADAGCLFRVACLRIKWFPYIIIAKRFGLITALLVKVQVFWDII